MKEIQKSGLYFFRGILYDLTGRLYTTGGKVYLGTKECHINKQRGRRFVCLKKKQINLKDIPRLPQEEEESDPFCEYVISENGYASYPCVAMDYWVLTIQMGKKLTVKKYKENYLNDRRKR